MKVQRDEYFKLAKPDGWDFFSGKTINYRESLGRKVQPPKYDGELKLCGPGIFHASKQAINCFIGAKIPCSMYLVVGKPVLKDDVKCGFTELEIREEIPEQDFDGIFDFKYSEAKNPLDPRKIPSKEPTEDNLTELRTWDSVRDSVRASVWASVRDSVWDSVWDSVRDSVRASVWASVWASVRDSVWDSEYAYIGSLFPKVETWKYTESLKLRGYPFQSAVNLLRSGFVPATDGRGTWYLLQGEQMKIATRMEIKKHG